MMLTVLHAMVVICGSSAEVVDSNSLAMQIASVFSKSVVLSFHPNAEKRLKGFIVCSSWYLIHSGLTSMW